MKYNVNTIDEYLSVIPTDRKAIIEKIISMVKEYFPDTKGTMEYDMPTYSPICAVASQKHHISLYINRVDLIEKYRKELGSLKVGKSCIRFRKLEQMPESVIRKIFNEI